MNCRTSSLFSSFTLTCQTVLFIGGCQGNGPSAPSTTSGQEHSGSSNDPSVSMATSVSDVSTTNLSMSSDPSTPTTTVAISTTLDASTADLMGSTALATDTAADTAADTDTGDMILPCETWDDNCPDGMKCIPYGMGTWNAQGCFDVIDRPGELGDPCQALDPEQTNADTCGKGLFCWVSTLTCMPLCQGSPSSFLCPDGFACATANNLVLAVCLPACDPRKLDCNSENEVCAFSLGIFECIQRQSELAVFSPCQTNNQCANGLACHSSDVAAECDQDFGSCCTALCTTDMAEPCPGVGQNCVPLLSLPDVPEYQDLGFCSL